MLQESKSKESVVESEYFLRDCSDAAQHWGVEIWIAKEQVSGGKKAIIQRADVALLLSKPCMMGVTMTLPKGTILVISVMSRRVTGRLKKSMLSMGICTL